METFPTHCPSIFSDDDDVLDYVSCAEVERLCRTLADLPPFVWTGADGSREDEDFIRLPSLHDRVESSRGKPAIPPATLWTESPFGGDAA